ncbi:MAG: hypothetical protein JSS53_08865 [Proteobacteria bacterium]|nr:hypothetical protein [Pseudomonadota bacterium]
MKKIKTLLVTSLSLLLVLFAGIAKAQNVTVTMVNTTDARGNLTLHYLLVGKSLNDPVFYFNGTQNQALGTTIVKDPGTSLVISSVELKHDRHDMARYHRFKPARCMPDSSFNPDTSSILITITSDSSCTIANS